MQLWPATIASPTHEVYAHGVYNYKVSLQQDTILLWREGADGPLLVFRGAGCAFFVYDDPPERTSFPGAPG